MKKTFLLPLGGMNLVLATLLVAFSGSAMAQSGTASNIALYAVPSTGKAVSPTGITPGPDGAMWFAEFASLGPGGQIGRITTSGDITLFPVATEGGAAGITAGPDGALWFTELSGKIGRITTSGIITEYPIPTRGEPQFITAGPDGALWFTVFEPPAIGRITTAGSITEYQIPTPDAVPEYITTGSDGALWFTDLNDEIGRITTSGVITEYPATGSPSGIAAGPDGALWFTETDSETIGRITTSGVITEYPMAGSNTLGPITAGPDQALWFVDGNGHHIFRITTTGVITQFATPGGNQFLQGIAAGPDGNLWFAQSGFTSTIGRAPACALGFSASFGNGTLTMNFNLGTSTPATFNIFLQDSNGGVSHPFSQALPAVVPPRAFTVNWTDIPNRGNVTVAPQLASGSPAQWLCSEWQTVNTAQ